jgi:hypothetical protein
MKTYLLIFLYKKCLLKDWRSNSTNEKLNQDEIIKKLLFYKLF